MKKKEVEKNEDLVSEVDKFLEEELNKGKSKTRTKKVKEEKEEKKSTKKDKKTEKIEEVKEEIKEEVKESPVVKESKKEIEKTVAIESVKEEVQEKEEVKDEKKAKKTQKNNEIDIDKVQAIEEMFDDDIYITRAFKPVKTKTKIKRGIVKTLIWIIVLGIIGLGLFYLGKTFLDNKNKTKPINIFKHAVKYTSDYAIKYLDNLNDSYGSIYEFSIDTNMNKYEVLDDEKFGVSFYNKDNYIMEYIYLDSGYGIYNVKNNNEYFMKYSSSNKLIRTEATDSVFRDLFMIGSKNDDLKYIIDKSNDIFNRIVEDKYFQVSNQVITINANEVDVIENSFVIDRYIKRELIKDYIKELKKDDKLIDSFANVLEVNSDEVVEVIEDKLNKIKSDNIIFNIYTDKKYNMIGIDLEVDGFTEAYLYKYEDKYDIQFNVFKYLNNFMEELELDVKKDTSLGFNGNKDDVSFAINKNLKSSLKISEFSSNKISIKYMGINGKYFNIDINVKNNSTALNLDDFNILSSNTKIKREIDSFYGLLDDKDTELIDYLMDIYY